MNQFMKSIINQITGKKEETNAEIAIRERKEKDEFASSFVALNLCYNNNFPIKDNNGSYPLISNNFGNWGFTINHLDSYDTNLGNFTRFEIPVRSEASEDDYSDYKIGFVELSRLYYYYGLRIKNSKVKDFDGTLTLDFTLVHGWNHNAEDSMTIDLSKPIAKIVLFKTEEDFDRYKEHNIEEIRRRKHVAHIAPEEYHF